MAWRKGESGNPSGRSPEHKTDHINLEPVLIPVLKRRDPANELVKLADSSDSARFKFQIWSFLFNAKYKFANVVPKAPVSKQDDKKTDTDLINELEGKK